MLLSFLFYILSQSKRKDIYLLLAGIASGFAILNHPMGFIAPIIIGVNILITGKGFKKILLQFLFFTIPIILAIPFWILNQEIF